MAGQRTKPSEQNALSGPCCQFYKWEPPEGCRTRRKWVRLFIGSASNRRICSVSAPSLSFLRAASWAFRWVSLFLLIERLLQDCKYRQIFVAAGRTLTLYNIRQASDLQLVLAELDGGRTIPQTFK